MSDDSKSASRLLFWLGIPFLVVLGLLATLAVLNRPPMLGVPSMKMPRPNGYDDLVKAAELACNIRPFGPYSSATKQPKNWTTAELKSWMQTGTPAFDMVRTGLSKKCAHPPVRSFNSIAGDPRMRELARCIAGEGLCYEVVGKPGKAADSYLDGAEIGVVIQRGAPLMSALLGNAVEMITIHHLEPILPKQSRDDLTRIASRMEKISAERVPYSDVMLEDARAVTAGLEEMFRTGNRLASVCDWDGNFAQPAARNPSTIAHLKYSVGFAFTDKTRMLLDNLSYFELLAKEQRGPYMGKSLKSSIPIPNNRLARVYGGMLMRARSAFAKNEAIFVVLQTEVALRRFCCDKGRYPNHLSELVPTYLRRVPVDPFGVGKPLRYSLINGRKAFVLYSLGPNMTDNHGVPGSGPYPRNLHTGDIVAGSIGIAI